MHFAILSKNMLKSRCNFSSFIKVKTKLRITKLAQRRRLLPATKLKKDEKILQLIRTSVFYKKARSVLFYLPIHGEVDITGIFEKDKKKKLFILPRINGDKLDLHEISDLQHTAKGKFSILEPKKTLRKISPQAIDLVLIPGVVFSNDGHRIGYGKGFYDRLLKKTSCPKIGIAYHFQIVKNIPGEPHDVPMDIIVTEKKILKTAPLKVKREKLSSAQKRG